jgi:hypothetical protein
MEEIRAQSCRMECLRRGIKGRLYQQCVILASCAILSLEALALTNYESSSIPESMVPRDTDHCNLCEESSTHGVLSVENNQRTECRDNVEPSVDQQTEKDGNGPACGVRFVRGR